MAVALDQRSYRFRNDDGSEAAATWKAAQNTPVTLSGGATFRLRFEVQETGGTEASTFPDRQLHLQYRKNGGAWSNVWAGSSVVRAVASQHVVADQATTNQLTAGTGTFSAGAVDEDDGALTVPTIAASGHTEVEFMLALETGALAPSDTLDFRLIRLSGAVLDSYTATAQVTIPASGGNLTISGSPMFARAEHVGPYGGGCRIVVGSTVRAPASLLNATQGWVALLVGPVSFLMTSIDIPFFSWGSGPSGLFLTWRNGDFDVRRETTAASLQLLVNSRRLEAEAMQPGARGWKHWFQVTFAWTATQIKCAVLGDNVGDFSTQANTEIPDLSGSTLFEIGRAIGLDPTRIDSPVHWFAAGSGAITYAEHLTLHRAFEIGAPLPADLPAGCTMVWPALSAAYLAA